MGIVKDLRKSCVSGNHDRIKSLFYKVTNSDLKDSISYCNDEYSRDIILKEIFKRGDNIDSEYLKGSSLKMIFYAFENNYILLHELESIISEIFINSDESFKIRIIKMFSEKNINADFIIRNMIVNANLFYKNTFIIREILSRFHVNLYSILESSSYEYNTLFRLSFMIDGNMFQYHDIFNVKFLMNNAFGKIHHINLYRFITKSSYVFDELTIKFLQNHVYLDKNLTSLIAEYRRHVPIEKSYKPKISIDNEMFDIIERLNENNIKLLSTVDIYHYPNIVLCNTDYGIKKLWISDVCSIDLYESEFSVLYSAYYSYADVITDVKCIKLRSKIPGDITMYKNDIYINNVSLRTGIESNDENYFVNCEVLDDVDIKIG